MFLCTAEKNENCLALGLKKRQASETAYCSMNSLITLDDLDGPQGLIDERSNEGKTAVEVTTKDKVMGG